MESIEYKVMTHSQMSKMFDDRDLNIRFYETHYKAESSKGEAVSWKINIRHTESEDPLTLICSSLRRIKNDNDNLNKVISTFAKTPNLLSSSKEADMLSCG